MRIRLVWIPILLLLSGCGYNRIQERDERGLEMRANIETELLRRADLIANLVATVEQAASFEQTTFVEVSRARSGLADARNELKSAVEGGGSPEALGRADAQHAANLRLFLNVAVEGYADRRGSRSFSVCPN